MPRSLLSLSVPLNACSRLEAVVRSKVICFMRFILGWRCFLEKFRRKKGGYQGIRRAKTLLAKGYLTALTIASNAFGSFIARSAITLRLRTMPLALSLPINCE